MSTPLEGIVDVLNPVWFQFSILCSAISWLYDNDIWKVSSSSPVHRLLCLEASPFHSYSRVALVLEGWEWEMAGVRTGQSNLGEGIIQLRKEQNQTRHSKYKIMCHTRKERYFIIVAKSWNKTCFDHKVFIRVPKHNKQKLCSHNYILMDINAQFTYSVS